MLLELAASGLLLLYAFPGNLQMVNYVAFGCVMLIWLVTFFVSVPIHNELITGLRHELVSRLVATNWLRTITWTLRTILLAYMMIKLIK
jgi:hypothetical protein